jgi:hypothetical protein
MSTEHPATPAPIALQPTEGEALWFMGFLATIKATADETAGRVAVIHHLGPKTPDRRFTCTTARTNGSTSSTAN